MKAIDFVVRGSAGGLQRGTVSADATNQVIVAGAGQEISINARQSDFASQVRSGDQLVITLTDGRTITIDNFFNDNGTASRLFVSSDGYLNEVSFVDAGQGNLYAQYGPTSEWGKWSPSDELIFLGNNDVAGVPLADGNEEVSMLGAALLGGGSLLGGGAALAAGLGGAALLGGGGGGGSGPAAPYVDNSDANVIIGGDGEEKTLTITGGGEPGDEVTVIVGDKEVDTVIDEDGKFEAVFEGDNFPADGVYDSEVVVTNGDGETTDLAGPSFEIDTIAPEITFEEGTESAGDFFNEISFADGVTLSGTGEAGASLTVTIAEVSRTVVISEAGTWSLSWESGVLEAGEYTTAITAVVSDSFGNTRSYTETLVVDTVHSVTIDSTVSTTVDGVAVVGDNVINGVEHQSGAIFSGSAAAGSTVEVTIGSVTIPVTAGSNGTWSATFSSAQLAEGDYTGTVTVVSTDTHGNVRNASGSFEVDTFVSDLAITSSTGGADGVIFEGEVGSALTVTGTTEVGSTSVMVELGGVTVPAIVNADGSWSATFAAGSIASGDYTATMTATATDAAGNVDTATTSVRVDTVAGTLTIDGPVEGNDIVNKDEASDGVILTGTADAGTIVTVTLEGVSHDVATAADGTWEAHFSASEVAPGDYDATITATITDPYGNTRTETDSVRVDTRVDNLSVATNDIATDNIISSLEHDGMVTVTGTTEVGSTSVMVTMGTLTQAATIDAAGNWSAVFDASGLAEGTYEADVSIVATDGNGNVQNFDGGTVQIDTEVKPLDMTSNSAGTDQVVNAAEAAAGIDLGGSVEAGSKVEVTFDGTTYQADVDAAGNWTVTIPAADVRVGAYPADIVVTATDHVGNVASINDTLSIDTAAPDGPVIASFTRAGDGIRGISIETVMEDGAPAADVQSVVQVAADGTISDVEGAQGYNSLRGETDFVFNDNVPNGSQLIVNATDAAGNTSGTFLVLDDEAATNSVDLTNMALGDYQIENLDLDFAEAASVVIDEASLLALSTASNTLTIHGSSEDQVIVQGGMAQGTQTVDGQTYNVYSVGAEGTLLVEQEVPVTI